MKNLLTNPIKYNHIITIEAIVITIAIHIGFLLLFSVKNTANSQENLGNVSTSLLNINDLNEEDQKAISYILKNHNPTLMTRGNSPYGFEAMLKKNRNNDFDNVDLTMQNHDKYMINYSDIKLNVVKPITLEYSDNYIDNLSGFTAIRNDKFKQSYPYAIASNGEVFPLQLASDKAKLISKYLVKASVIKVVKDEDNFLRINVLQSSGRRDFDQLASQALQKILIEKSDMPQELIYTVFYNEEIE